MYDDNYNSRSIGEGGLGLLLRTVVPFLLLATVGYFIVSGDCSVPFIEDPFEIATLDCNDSALIEEVVKLSQQNRQENPIHYEIFKIYSTELVKRTSTRLDCRGEALLDISGGADDLYDLRYYAYTDRDGDIYIGYEFE